MSPRYRYPDEMINEIASESIPVDRLLTWELYVSAPGTVGFRRQGDGNIVMEWTGVDVAAAQRYGLNVITPAERQRVADLVEKLWQYEHTGAPYEDVLAALHAIRPAP